MRVRLLLPEVNAGDDQVAEPFVPAAVADRGRFLEAIRRIDVENAADPRRITTERGSMPYELLYSQHLTRWVSRLAPQASEALALAARGQHIARWMIPREKYAQGLRGYLEWRETLKAFHAEKMAVILRDCGYGPDLIGEVRLLVTKERLPEDDPETQALEDALCLVFLELQLGEVMARHPRAKVLDILGKTLAKMSGEGRTRALALNLPAEAVAMVREAAG